MTTILTIIEGPDSGRFCELASGRVLTVGRGSGCDFRLSDPGVSRVHCRLHVEADGVRLEDAESRYGTRVNQRSVAGQMLIPGDTIGIGDTEMRLETAPAPAETLRPVRLPATSLEWLPQESVTFDASEPPSASAPDPDVQGLAGSTFVRFHVETLTHRTLTGVGYRAQDTIHHRPVALKIYRPALFVDESAMSRFLRSMRATVPLQHEHLVKLYAAGRSRGLCFTASEFVEGESAAERIGRIGIAGMLDWRSAWRIGVSLGKALSYLHGRSILHRSLQPANIFIRTADQCVKLGDSLLAKSVDELGQVALTARGDVVGDVYYLAPEQLSEGAGADHRSDIYSLGATLYALLTGRPPFLGPPADVVRQIQFAPPEPPKTLQLAIPSAFEGIVLRMLEKRPENRFQSAGLLLAELQRVGQYEGLAMPVSSGCNCR